MRTFEVFLVTAAKFLKKGKIMLYSTLALGVFLAAAPAHAQTAGDTCDQTQFGQTKLATDQTDIIACLYTDNTKKALVWKSAYSSNSEGSYVQNADGSCREGNPLITYHPCECPSGYVASPVSYDVNSVAQSGGGYSGGTPYPIQSTSTPTIGYTCIPGTEATAPGHWVDQGGAHSCAIYGPAADPNQPPAYCNPPPLNTPCTPGNSGYVIGTYIPSLQTNGGCYYGNYEDCMGGSQKGWELDAESYTCVAN